VYALGECAQHDGQVYGLVAPAWEQAAVLADVLTQRAAQPRSARPARYRGSRLVIRLKAADIELAAMGETAAAVDEAESNAEVVQFVDPARGTYKKVVIRDGQLVGAILLGDIGTVGSVTQLYDRGSQVPADRLALLFAGRGVSDTLDTPAGIPDAATICRCNGVTKGAITDCWVAGARTADEVTAATRAATGCGSCRDAVDGILSWLAASDSVGRNKSA
jgi:assimilatory nitrate reductase electron transfer subunit